MLPIRESKEGTCILERKKGQRQKRLGSCLTHTKGLGLGLSPSGSCPACWTLNPWEFQRPPSVFHILFLLTVHLQRLVKHTDFPGGLGALPPNKRH